MRTRTILIMSIALCLGFAAAVPAARALAEGVEVRFDLTDPQGGPFPADRFTVPDATQLTGLHVELSKPDCSVLPSDCDDIDVLNTLDGFNLQPRLSIPFTGPIDLNTISSETLFLFKLNCRASICPGGSRVGINQAVWDPATKTLYAESDRLLDQDARYLLVVTNGIRDPGGERIDADHFRNVLHAGQTNDPAEAAYREALIAALDQLKDTGMPPGRVAAASLFTTQSATALLEKIRDQLAQATPAPPDFLLGANGERTVFPFPDVASIAYRRQVSTTPTFSTRLARLDLLKAVPDAPDAVGTIAFGRYRSPDYMNEEGVIPPVGTATGAPVVQRTNDVYFNVFLPSGPEPAGGWPVVIAGHGVAGPMGRGNKNEANVPLAIAAKLAQRGLATVAPEIVGHGSGPLGTLKITRNDITTVTLPGGGRSVDRNGDGVIAPDEGLYTSVRGRQAIVLARDGLAQTVVDLMQLVREIQVGMDIDGDSTPDLDATRIYYFGSSLGSVYGAPFVALDRGVRGGVFNVSGGTIVENRRLTRGADRATLGQLLGSRVPSLLNGGPDPLSATNPFPFRENLPLRNAPSVVNDVPGAIAIQDEIERIEWATQASSPVAFAPHLRTAPLAGGARRVLYSFAKGDWVVANPLTAAILRAGDLADRATFFRFDLACPFRLGDLTCPAMGTTNPHEFAFLLGADETETARMSALQVQEQAATFLASDGQETIDPDGPSSLFETPIAGPPPESLCFIPFREAESSWRTLELPCS
jgi:hypothetical protein